MLNMKFCDGPLEKRSQFYYREHERGARTVEYSAPLHIHQSAEILYVLQGKIDIRITGKKPEAINDGEAALIFPFQAHEYHRAAGTHYIRFNFDSALASDFFAPLENLSGIRSVFAVSDSTAFLIKKRFVENKELTRLCVQSFLYSALADFASQIELCERSADDNILVKAISFMRKNKKKSITINEVAEAIGYSKSHLSYVINKSAGFGYNTLLSMLRMEDARILLRDTKKSMLEIALECGFGSERSFYRQFKAIIGKSPHEYRKSRDFSHMKDPLEPQKKPTLGVSRSGKKRSNPV